MAQKNIYEMTDRELKLYKKTLRLRRARRQKMLFSTIIFVATICIILMCSMVHSSFRANASHGFKYYTNITVGVDETLWDIAEEYIDYSHYDNINSYIAEVKSINHLDENGFLLAGQMIIVPYYAEEYR